MTLIQLEELRKEIESLISGRENSVLPNAREELLRQKLKTFMDAGAEYFPDNPAMAETFRKLGNNLSSLRIRLRD